MEVVDFAQVGPHEVQEFAVGIYEYDAELLRLSFDAQRLDVVCNSQFGAACQFYLAVLVEFQTVLGRRFGFLFRILQRALHL